MPGWISISSHALEEFLNGRSDFLVVVDRQLNIVHANSWFCDLVQPNENSIAGTNLTNLLPSTWCKRFNDAIALLEGRSHVHIDDLRTSRGDLVVTTSADIFKNENGDQNSILIIIQNRQTGRTYTDIMQMLEDPGAAFLQRKEYRDVFNLILDTAITISGMDSGGIYVFDAANKMYRQVFHKGLSEEFVRESEIHTKDARYRYLFSNEDLVYREYVHADLPDDDFRKKEGLTISVAIPVNLRGQTIGSLNVASHEKIRISEQEMVALKAMRTHVEGLLERLLAEHERNKTEVKYRALVENLQEAVFTLTSDGIFTYVSPVIKDITGYNAEDIVGRPFSDFIYPDDLDPALKSFEHIVSGQFQPLEYRIITSSGEPKYVRTFTRIITGKDAGMEFTGILTDIHERKMTELALQESEEKFKAVSEATTAAIFLIQDKQFAYVNSAFVDVTGYTFDDVRGEDFFFMVHPDHRELTRERGRARQQGEDVPSRYEFKIIHKSGETRWVDFSATRTIIDGKPGMLGSAFDITERKMYEEQVTSSEEKFSKAFHTNPAAMTLNNFADGRYIDFNEAAEKLSGYSREEATAKTVFELDIFAREDEQRQFIDHMMRYGSCRNQEYHLKSKDGAIRNCLLSADVFKWGGEKTIIASSVDITERKEAELKIQEQYQKIQAQYEELEEMTEELETTHNEILDINNRLFHETEKLETTLRSIGDGVITTDLNGNIGMCNNMASEILRRSTNELKGKNISDILSLVKDDSGKPIENVLSPVFEKETMVAYSDVKLVTDGERSPDVEMVASPVRGINIGLAGVVIVIRDVTSRKKMELELIKSSKIESLGVFAGGIAHDFNNLLTAILGNISLARMVSDNEKIHDILSDAEKASERAKTLTQQLLTFSRGGAPVKKVMSLGPLLKDIVAFVLSGSSIECRYRIDDDLKYINADEGQVSQVIQNIVINARQAMQDAGTLYIEARNVEDAPSTLPANEDGYVAVTIRDEGPGMEKEVKDRIFDPYYTTRDRGSGLGLSVAYSIVTNHGGRITVRSEKGEGTEFTFYLPASGDESGTREEYSVAAYSDEGRVLVMDDEKDILTVLSGILESIGYQVDTSSTGEDALDTFARAAENGNPYDCVILDLTIPGHAGGADIIKSIRFMQPNVKAIVSSGYANNQVLSNYRDYGFDGILSKPYTHADVVKIIKEVMG